MSHSAAIILAAGQSRRMGQPKMLMPWAGKTILGQVISTFAEAGVDDIVVVTGGWREEVEGLVSQLAGEFAVRTIFNEQHTTGGMLCSIQTGLAGLGPETGCALIGLGDQPQLGAKTVRKLLSAFELHQSTIIVPSFEKHRGHPWLVKRELWPELCSMPAERTARDFLNAHAGEILYIEADASILQDIDTPEDYARQS